MGLESILMAPYPETLRTTTTTKKKPWKTVPAFARAVVLKKEQLFS